MSYGCISRLSYKIAAFSKLAKSLDLNTWWEELMAGLVNQNEECIKVTWDRHGLLSGSTSTHFSMTSGSLVSVVQ